MNFAQNQMLQADLIQLLLSSQAGNVNFWNPTNVPLAPHPIIGLPAIPAAVPQQFQFLPPFLPVAEAPGVATPFPATQQVPEDAVNSVTKEPCHEHVSTSEPPFPFEMGSIPTTTYYPTHFMRGTQLSIANGDIKKVEDLSSDDFLRCAAESDDVIVNASVVKSIKTTSVGSATIVFETGIERDQISLKCQIEHPFFVLGKGWSSCKPSKSGENYGLDCECLQVDDVCIVLTQKEDERAECAVDIVTAERDMELFSRRAALREQLVEIYYENLSGRVSAPPERIPVESANCYRQRRTSE